MWPKNRLARFIRDTHSIDSTALLGLLLFEIEIGTGIGIDFLHSSEWTDSHEAIGLVPSDGCWSVRRLFRTPMPHSRSKGRRRRVFRVPNPWRSIPVPVPISIGCPNVGPIRRGIPRRIRPWLGLCFRLLEVEIRSHASSTIEIPDRQRPKHNSPKDRGNVGGRK